MSEAVIATHPVMTKLDTGMLASGITTGGGGMLWLSHNASAIGAIVMVISLIITALFLFLNYRATIKGQQINDLNIEARVIRKIKRRASPQEKKLLEDLLS